MGYVDVCVGGSLRKELNVVQEKAKGKKISVNDFVIKV